MNESGSGWEWEVVKENIARKVQEEDTWKNIWIYIAVLMIGVLIYHALMVDRSDLFLYIVYLTVDTLILIALLTLFTGVYQQFRTTLTVMCLVAALAAMGGIMYTVIWKKPTQPTDHTDHTKNKYEWIGLCVLSGVAVMLVTRLCYQPDVEVLFRRYGQEDALQQYEEVGEIEDPIQSFIDKTKKSSNK